MSRPYMYPVCPDRSWTTRTRTVRCFASAALSSCLRPERTMHPDRFEFRSSRASDIPLVLYIKMFPGTFHACQGVLLSFSCLRTIVESGEDETQRRAQRPLE